MFGISFTEILVVCFIILIIFGPKQLPELASKLGKIIGTFRKTSDKFRREFYNTVYEPAKTIDNQVNQDLKAVKEEFKKIEEDIKADE